jgi:sulfite reductase alpha subunit-like flavoprotein
LYQGCRSAAKDRHYGEEFDKFAGFLTDTPVNISNDSNERRFEGEDEKKDRSRGIIESKLIYRVACSRDGPPGVPRTYVQDLMRKDSGMLWDALGRRGGVVYISG